MKRILIILLVLIFIVVGTAYLLFIKTITPDDVPSQVMNAEEVISTSGTIAIASVDMRYLRRIDEIFKKAKDPSPMPSPNLAKSKKEKTFLEKLKNQGVDLTSDTDYALASINIGLQKPVFTFVLFGNYSKVKLKQAIQKNYHIDERTNDYWLITQIDDEKKIIDPCVVPLKTKLVAKQQALLIQNDRILLSSPELMPVLIQRFSKKTRAEVSLAKWREFRKEKAAAGAFLSPKNAKKSATDLPSSLLLGAISNQPLNEVYAGAVISLLPEPGFTFLIDAHSNKPAWPLEVKTKYDDWLSETISELKGMPILASLFQTIKVKADGNILRFSALADQSTLDNIEKIPNEILKMAFSGVFGEGDETGHTGTEQIVKNSEVERYAPHFDFSSVQPFDDKNIFFKPDFVAGPFGIRLKKIGLLATDDSVIELKINAEGKGFENLSGESMHKSDEPMTSLRVTRVEDKEGNNILREELCGKKRNLIEKALSTTRDKVFENNEWISKSIKINGDKSVRLKQNTALSDVAKIKGKIVVRAATRTKTSTFQIPFAKKTLNSTKVRMYLKKSNPSTIKYDLSGDISRILAVRAKNTKGEYIASNGSSASSYDGIKTISKHFKGKISSIEVVIAEEMQSEEYPFEISQISPRYGKEGDGNEVEMMFTSKKRFLRKHSKVKYKNECKEKQSVRVGAFMICMNKFGDQFGREVGGEFSVIAPYEQALQNDISAAVLSIDTVQTESGEKISFAKKEKVDFAYKFDTNYNDKKKEWEIINRRLQASYVKIFSNKKEFKDKKISTIKGSLLIRLPKSPKYIELRADDLGVVKKNKDGIIANISAYEDWNTYIDLQGSTSKVMRFVPISNKRTVLNTNNDSINEKQYNIWGMLEEDKEKIKALPKMSQGMITVYGKPEMIRVYYANNFETIKHKFQFTVK